jgi:hypothetical protein
MELQKLEPGEIERAEKFQRRVAAAGHSGAPPEGRRHVD